MGVVDETKTQAASTLTLAGNRYVAHTVVDASGTAALIPLGLGSPATGYSYGWWIVLFQARMRTPRRAAVNRELLVLCPRCPAPARLSLLPANQPA